MKTGLLFLSLLVPMLQAPASYGGTPHRRAAHSFRGTSTRTRPAPVSPGRTLSNVAESFEGAAFPPAGWLVMSPDGNEGWSRQTAGTSPVPGFDGGSVTAAPGGGNAVAFVRYGDVSTYDDQWLVTPQIADVQAGDSLKFWLKYWPNSYTDTFEVRISTSGTNMEDFLTLVQTLPFVAPGADTAWHQYAYGLGGFVAPGSNIYVAFREYVDDNLVDGASFSLDLVQIGPPVLHDIQTLSAGLSPPSPDAGQNVTVSAIIRNGGTEMDPAAVPLTYKVGGIPESPSDGTVQVFIPTWSDHQATVTFTQPFTAPSAGLATVGVRSFYGFDQLGDNDSVSVTTDVNPAGTILWEHFTYPAFPPSGWTAGTTAPVSDLSRGQAVQSDGTNGYAAKVGFYNQDSLAFDTLASPVLDLSGLVPAATPKNLSFDHAYQGYSSTSYFDSVRILASSNGGTTWSALLYNDGNPGMQTAGISLSSYTPSSASQWRHHVIPVPAGMLAGAFRLAVVGKSAFGNNFWIDNIRISSRTDTTINVSLSAGWMMISLPVDAADDTARHWFPTLISHVYRFSNGYVAGDVMLPGVGYWGKFPAAITQPVTGFPLIRDSISVVTGWNMVGSISATVDTSTIVSVPPGLRASSWFGYAGGYVTVSQITPGKAYWIKSTGSGKFVFANPAANGPARGGSATVLERLNTVTVTDSRGGSQTLYFGTDEKKEIGVSMYAMPPLPPTGAFDARFETAEGGTMVQTHGQASGDLTVKVQSEAYPLTVSWSVQNGEYEVTAGGKVQSMRGEGRMEISSSEVERITLKLTGEGQVPVEYGLSQNYPNPFNPATKISYALPVQSRVRVEIYNVLGQRVSVLVNEDKGAGYHVAEWNGTGSRGEQLGSGVYFLQLTAQGINGKSFSAMKKLMLLK